MAGRQLESRLHRVSQQRGSPTTGEQGGADDYHAMQCMVNQREESFAVDLSVGYMGSKNGSSTAPIAVEIVERMSDKMDICVMDMPPLSNRLDVDALEALISDQADKEGRVTIQFEFQDRIVQVDSNRAIDIT